MSIFQKPAIDLGPRIRIALICCAVAFFILVVRLWYLQIIHGEYFRNQSENNRLRTVFVPPPRGTILDRSGEVLVRNRPSFNIDFVKEDTQDIDLTLSTLAEILKLKKEDLLTRLQTQKKRRRFEPKLLVRDVDRDQLARVMANRYRLPGVFVSVVPAREYPYGPLGSHILGYIREVTREQLQKPEFASYRPGDLVGQYGIEQRWERYLQGRRGVQRVVVNATGTRIGQSSFIPEQEGLTVTLTIDQKVQQVADRTLQDKRGAIVAMDPNTGEILALSSAPSFNANIFSGEVTGEYWRELITGPDRVMNNRAVQGAYPPGSIFKIIMAVASLAEGAMSSEETVYCPGYLKFGSRRYHCHKRSGHGKVNLRDALVHSCDVYFYTLAQRLGVDRIHDYAKRFGLGNPAGIDLVYEAKGLVPSTEWKRKYFRKKEDQIWYPGETLSVGIGQGALLTTPLQIVRAVSALVNGGNVLRPVLVREVRSPTGGYSDTDFHSIIQNELEVEPWILNVVQQDLRDVVHDERGTGKRSRLAREYGIEVGGKTGTAQVVSLSVESDKEEFKDHAWFVGFAPAEEPEIVVTALIENGGSGGAVAAPVVREVLEAFFKEKDTA